MYRITLFAVISCVLFGSCATANRSEKAAQQSDKHTFSYYDTASGSPTAGAANGPPAIEFRAVNESVPTTAAIDARNAAQAIATESAEPNIQININRKVIRNADLFLEADVPEATQQQITAIAQKAGGFVIESQQESSDVKVNVRDVATMSIRVPADNFTETLEEIRATATRVVTQSVKGEDVTEEFIDIEARIRAKRALEQQFIEILKRTNTVQEAMGVQSQIAQVRADIEKIEGRKRFLENQSSLSTIKVRIQTPAAISANSTGFVYKLRESFSGGLEFAMSFVLGLVSLVVAILPFAVFIGLPGYLVIRYFWKKHVAPKSVMEIAQDEIRVE